MQLQICGLEKTYQSFNQQLFVKFYNPTSVTIHHRKTIRWTASYLKLSNCHFFIHLKIHIHVQFVILYKFKACI